MPSKGFRSRFSSAKRLLRGKSRRPATEPAYAEPAPADQEAVAEGYGPRDLTDYLNSAAALRDAGQPEAAEVLLVEAGNQYPSEAAPTVEWAELAQRRCDWGVAAQRWEVVRTRFPDQPVGYTRAAAALREQGRVDEAEAVVHTAREQFPHEVGPLHDLARLAEHRRAWAEAEQWWRAYLAQERGVWFAHTGLAAALRELGRLDEAETILHAAWKHFPHETGPLHDLARLAERRSDWTAADRWWREYLALEGRHWIAHEGLAVALREQGRVEEAEALLLEQQRVFPEEFALFAAYARFAEERRDWAAAVERWDVVREQFSDRWEGYRGSALALRELGRVDDAEAVLLTAQDRLPREVSPLHDLARLAELRRDWSAAEWWWRAYLTLENRHWFAHTGLAAALREQGRIEEAETLLLEQQPAFPQDPWPFVDYAQLAEGRRDWSAALDRWAAARQRFPDRWLTYSGEARALRELGRLDEAETVLLDGQRILPDEVGALHDLARLAEYRRDWAAAEQWWQAYLALESKHWFAVTGLAAALREQGRTTEAEVLLLEQQDAFPQELALFADYAQLAEGRRDWSAALERWAAARERFPDRWLTYSGEARTLRELGRLEEAETVLRAARECLPRETGVLHDLARLAEQRGDWAAAEQWWGAYLAIENRDWFAHTGLAAALREQGRLDEAETLLLAARESFPGVGGPLHDLAVLAERRRDWAAAEQWWRASLSIENPPWWAYTRLAAVLSELGRVTEAETLLLEQQHASPGEFGLFADYARLAEGRRDWPVALERWTATRERFPHQWDGYRGTALALRELGRLEEAETVLRSAQEHLPRETGVLHDLARLAEHRRDWTAAEHGWRAFLALDDRRWFAHTGLAAALYEQGKADEAAAVLDRSAALLPDDGEILVMRLRRAKEARNWQMILDVSDQYRDHPPAAPHLFDVGRIRLEALIATGAVAQAASEFEAFASAQAGQVGLTEIATNLALQSQNLEWLRTSWKHLLAIPQTDAAHLGGAAVAIYQRFYAQPGSEFLIHWILTQEASADRVDWMPAGAHLLASWLNSYIEDLDVRAAGTGAEAAADPAECFAAAYSMVDPSHINPLVRGLLGPWSGNASSADEYRQLIERMLRNTTETVWPRTVFLTLLWVLKQGYPDGALRPDTILAVLAGDLVGSGEFFCVEHAAGLLLLLMGADMHAKPTYAAILEMLRLKQAWLPTEPDFSTPSGLLRNLVQKTFDDRAPAVIGGPRSLRLALEISGHLRGYKAARESWDNLRLAQHELHTVVYCAKKVGHRPISDGGHFRTFPPHLARAFTAAVFERGWTFIQNQYADFTRELAAAGEAIVTEQEMLDFYGAEAAMVVDEEQPEYASRGPFWRMYRGMHMAHQMAVETLPECDLYVRMRPDYQFRADLEPDWWDLFVRSRRDRVIFSDHGRAPQMGRRLGLEFFTGDQFAFGTCEVMDTFARSFLDVSSSQAGRFFGYSSTWLPHENVALSTFYDGIAVETLHEPGAGHVLNTPAPSTSELYQALLRQIGPQPRHDVDLSLLEALRLDQQNESGP